MPTSNIHPDMGLDLKDLTYSQFLHYVSQTNFKNLWKEAQKKFPETYRPFLLSRTRRSQQRATDGQEVLRTLLSRIYGCPVISLENGSIIHPTNQQKNYSLKAFGIFETSSHFVVITEHIPHSVHQCLNLSPALLNPNSIKPCFILFQMLHAIKEMQDSSLFVEGVSWQQVFIGDNLTIKILPAVAQSLIPVEQVHPSKSESSLQELTVSWVVYLPEVILSK